MTVSSMSLNYICDFLALAQPALLAFRLHSLRPNLLREQFAMRYSDVSLRISDMTKTLLRKVILVCVVLPL